MALFTDGPISTPMDLRRFENAILNVADIEGIDLSGKIALAQHDIANQIMLFLLRRLQVQEFPWSLSRARRVDDVVVTPALRQWHAHKTLAVVYRDAYNNQLNDRYLNKWNEYEQLAKDSAGTYFQIGVGVVADPIGKPAVPALATAPGPGPGGTYYIVVTWVNHAGQEGAPSDVTVLTTLDGEQVVISGTNPPANASGWNVYAGLSPNALGLQNDAPIALNNTWMLAATPIQGRPAGEGQPPTWHFVDHRVIQRG